MSKKSLLSHELSKLRALVAGGMGAEAVLLRLKAWAHETPLCGSRAAHSPRILWWHESVCNAVHEALPLGAPLSPLFKELQPIVRREEILWQRLQGVERQFAFQGAVALVLPWVVAVAQGGISLNFFSVGAAVLQSLGLFGFYFLIRRPLRSRSDEMSFLFDFLIGVWTRVRAGHSLRVALESSLNRLKGNDPLDADLASQWRQWFDAHVHGVVAQWRANLQFSENISSVLESLLNQGAPAHETLMDFVLQIENERQNANDEKISGLPSRLSLVFCLFFTPAVFMILLGSLWPNLTTLMM